MQNKQVEKVLILGREMNESVSKSNVISEELQSCLAVLQKGLDVVLLSNATNLTNQLKTVLNIPIYNMPLSKESVTEVVDKEMPDVVCAPFFGSSGWKLLRELDKEEYWQGNVIRAVGLCYDQSYQGKRGALKKADVKYKRAYEVSSLKEAEKRLADLGGVPVLLRTEHAAAISIDKKEEFCSRVLVELEKISEEKIILEENIDGSKEIEVGILRDTNGFAQAVYTTENIRPVKFDSDLAMSVSPIQSLDEKQTKEITDIALKVANKLENFAGYCTIQLLHSHDKEILVTDINFELPKSPAAISLALGCSLVNVMVQLELGCLLKDLMLNQKSQLRQQERVILKIPEYNKNRSSYPGSIRNRRQEYIYIGQNFCETLVKAIEENSINWQQSSGKKLSSDCINNQVDERSNLPLDVIVQAFVDGMTIEEIALHTNVDTWFLIQIELVCELWQELHQKELEAIKKEDFSLLKACGFSDGFIARLLSFQGRKVTEAEVSQRRNSMNISAVTVLHYERCLGKENRKRKILILSASKVNSKPLQVPAVVLVQEARRMGFEVMLMTTDMDAVSFWMAFVDRIYIDAPTKENISEINQCEKPSAVFIDGEGLFPGYLEKYLTEIGLTTVRVPFKLPDQLSNTNGTH